VLEFKVLILELVSINGFTTSTILGSKVTSLTHELRNDTMERAAFIAETLFACAQSSEVFFLISK
jgi:E3 ubiquitin-protein ligase DOA10